MADVQIAVRLGWKASDDATAVLPGAEILLDDVADEMRWRFDGARSHEGAILACRAREVERSAETVAAGRTKAYRRRRTRSRNIATPPAASAIALASDPGSISGAPRCGAVVLLVSPPPQPKSQHHTLASAVVGATVEKTTATSAIRMPHAARARRPLRIPTSHCNHRAARPRANDHCPNPLGLASARHPAGAQSRHGKCFSVVALLMARSPQQTRARAGFARAEVGRALAIRARGAVTAAP
jgi:hypothetical protein